MSFLLLLLLLLLLPLPVLAVMPAAVAAAPPTVELLPVRVSTAAALAKFELDSAGSLAVVLDGETSETDDDDEVADDGVDCEEVVEPERSCLASPRLGCWACRPERERLLLLLLLPDDLLDGDESGDADEGRLGEYTADSSGSELNLREGEWSIAGEGEEFEAEAEADACGVLETV